MRGATSGDPVVLPASRLLGVRVLMVSWEYPPVVIGGLGRHVHALARELGAMGLL